ncbi:MAG: tetratricopeptide repeat protein [Pseudomonadota bacterium]
MRVGARRIAAGLLTAVLICGCGGDARDRGDRLATSGSAADGILPEVPDGVQAISLLGEELVAAPAREQLIKNLASAEADYRAAPDDADTIIWMGRRVAYTADYRRAIRIFTEGVEKFPDDARMYRHRGHRYISVRELDRAIADLEKGAKLIAGTEDEVEPDGAPNPAGIPVSTLHSNIWYHLGLAYYLKGDLDNALRVYKTALAETPNDDMRVATTHWAYMSLRLLGRDEDAKKVLRPIHAEMNVIESMAYHQLCLLYKGEGEISAALTAGITPAGGDSARYGVANWHYYNGRKDEAKTLFQSMIDDSGWASFGRIAAESDLARKF